MTKSELAENLSNQIKNKRTVRAIQEAFTELYEESNGNFDIINEVVDIMDDELRDCDILNEQFDNKGQLNAMTQLHQVVAQARVSKNGSNGSNGKK